MSWFPLFIDLKDRPCLVAGGGQIALHKVQTLLSFGAKVTVIAKELHPEFSKMPVVQLRREVLPSDVNGMELVIDATADRAVGEMLSKRCAQCGIPINVVDTLELCSCIFPAMLRRGPMLAAVSTAGASPAAAAWARDRLDEVLPDRFEEILEQMRLLRRQIKTEIHDSEQRGKLLKRCFAAAIEKGAPLSREELAVLLEEGR